MSDIIARNADSALSRDVTKSVRTNQRVAFTHCRVWKTLRASDWLTMALQFTQSACMH